MTRQIKKGISLLLTLAVMATQCVGTVAFAANETNIQGITIQATLNQSEFTKSNEAQTVVMTLSGNASFNVCSVGYTITWDPALTLTSIASESLGLTAVDYNLGNGKVSWYSSDVEDVSVTEFGTITFTIPANTNAGTYTVGVESVEFANEYGGNVWEYGATASATITIKDPEAEVHTHEVSGPTWTWADDNALATAELTCAAAGCDWTNGKISATDDAIEETVTREATCTAPGSKTLTASVTLNGKTYTDTKTVTTPLADHTMKKTEAVAATCTKSGNNAYWTCEICGQVFSDEAGLTPTTVSAQRVPATGHHYGNGACTVCGAEQGAYEVYYELYDSEGNKLSADEDNDSALDVVAGETYTAKVFVKPSADRDLRGFELNLTYDSANMTVTNDETVKKYDTAITGTGTIKYELYKPEDDGKSIYSMTANTGLQVAQFTFTLNAEVPANTAMTFGFGGKNEVAVTEEVAAVAVATLTSSAVDTLDEFTVTWDTANGDASTTTTVAYGQSAVAPGADPVKTGYTFEGWYLSTDETKTPITSFPGLTADTTYIAKWTATTYDITYDLNGGSGDAIGSYNIEDGALPTPTKPGCTFGGWKVTAVDGESNLTVNEVVTNITGHYGNVSLTAQWTVVVGCSVVDYTYAGAGQALLIVSTAAREGKAVVTLDGTPMYHIAADNAAAYISKLTSDAVVAGADGVYVTLISYSEGDTFDADQITFVDGTNEELTYDCKIDGDADVDFNDASIVYQMVKNGGSAFTTDALGIKARLLADVDHDCAGSITDVDKIAEKFGS